MSTKVQAPRMMNANELLEQKDKQNDLEINHFVKVPDKIEQEVYDKWFYAYNWIWEEDVKNSLERDYLKYLSVLAKVFIVLISIFAVILYISMDTNNANLIFFLLKILFGFIVISNIWIIAVIIVKAVSRFKIFFKNAYVILTDTHIYFNGSIKKYSDIWEKDRYFLQEISETFEEPLFETSNLEVSKRKFTDKIFSIVPSQDILSSFWKGGRYRGGNSWWIVIIILIGYLLYFLWIVSVFFLYVISTIFIWIIGRIISSFSRKVLIARWHEITIITSLFEDISKKSLWLVDEKKNLIHFLNEASDNNWQDSLWTKMDKSIENINSYALGATNSSLSLKKAISNSRYKEMFNSGKYNVWIKWQIQEPLEWISKLLASNLESIKNQISAVDYEISRTQDERHIWQLGLAKQRLGMKMWELEKNKEVVDGYVVKLKV